MSLSVYQDLGYLASALGQASTSRPTLRKGSRGAAVTELQQALAAQGLVVINATDPSRLSVEGGVFDANTDEAVRQFQARAKLAVDGVVGPNTWSKLLGVKVTGTGGGGPVQQQPPPTQQQQDTMMKAADDKILGLHKMYVYAGGAVLLLGALFLLSPRRISQQA